MEDTQYMWFKLVSCESRLRYIHRVTIAFRYTKVHQPGRGLKECKELISSYKLSLTTAF